MEPFEVGSFITTSHRAASSSSSSESKSNENVSYRRAGQFQFTGRAVNTPELRAKLNAFCPSDPKVGGGRGGGERGGEACAVSPAAPAAGEAMAHERGGAASTPAAAPTSEEDAL